MEKIREGAAACATQTLLQLAKEIAAKAFGQAEEATVREVFMRLCYETDTRFDAEPNRELNVTLH